MKFPCRRQGVSEQQILLQRSIEKHGILQEVTDLGSQALQAEISNVHPVDVNGPPVHVIQTGNELNDSAFATPTHAD